MWDSGAEVWEQFDLYDDWRDVDDEENRIEYPEGFQWTCCGKAHDDPGCVFDEHDPTDGTKRMKESEPDNVVNLVSDEEDDDGDEDEDESDSEDVE